MKTKIVFSDEAVEIYDLIFSKAEIYKKERMLLSAIHNKIELIKLNRYYGSPIAKKLIPEEYKIKYNAANLFRVELPLFWRMFYTLTSDKIEIIAFVVDVLDHN